MIVIVLFLFMDATPAPDTGLRRKKRFMKCGCIAVASFVALGTISLTAQAPTSKLALVRGRHRLK